MAKKVSKKKTTKKAAPKKKQLKVDNPPVEPTLREVEELMDDVFGDEDNDSGLPVLEIQIPPAFVGETIEGSIYVVTHACPMCEAAVETVGAGYPVMRCSMCGVPMRALRSKVKDEV